MSKLQIEEQWHCELGNAINEKWENLRNDNMKLIEKIIDTLPELKSDVKIISEGDSDE